MTYQLYDKLYPEDTKGMAKSKYRALLGIEGIWRGDFREYQTESNPAKKQYIQKIWQRAIKESMGTVTVLRKHSV